MGEAAIGEVASEHGSPEDTESLCYSTSDDPAKGSKKSSLDWLSDAGSRVMGQKPAAIDKEVQVQESELQPMSQKSTRGRPPLLPENSDSNSSISSASSFAPSCPSPMLRRRTRKRRSSRNSQLPQADKDEGPLRLTAPFYKPSSKACIDTSAEWLLHHWNFHYHSSCCCPRHAALMLAADLWRNNKKDACNPLWSPFTGWQCGFCTAMNHEESMICDLCGARHDNRQIECSASLSQSVDTSDSSQDDVHTFAALVGNVQELGQIKL